MLVERPLDPEHHRFFSGAFLGELADCIERVIGCGTPETNCGFSTSLGLRRCYMDLCVGSSMRRRAEDGIEVKIEEACYKKWRARYNGGKIVQEPRDACVSGHPAPESHSRVSAWRAPAWTLLRAPEAPHKRAPRLARAPPCPAHLPMRRSPGAGALHSGERGRVQRGLEHEEWASRRRQQCEYSRGGLAGTSAHRALQAHVVAIGQAKWPTHLFAARQLPLRVWPRSMTEKGATRPA